LCKIIAILVLKIDMEGKYGNYRSFILYEKVDIFYRKVEILGPKTCFGLVDIDLFLIFLLSS